MKRALFVALLLVALPYFRSRVYRFPAPEAFSGSHFFNPYGNLGGTWLRANFHAHSRAWGGLTNGSQSDQEVVQAYHDLGYAVAALSNYEHLSTSPAGNPLPVYEHGYNVSKRHQLALGARRVEWFDFPLLQSTSDEQAIIDLLKKDADLVALAHPSLRDAYSLDDLEQLTGYDLLEMVNGQFLNRQAWDAALSSGHAVWGLANDDGHDIRDTLRMATAWNMVDAPSAAATDVLPALRAGRFYAVLRLDKHPEADLTELQRIEFTDGTLTVTCTGAHADFQFTGQGGVEHLVVRDALSASYTFDEKDPFIRLTIWSPRRMIFLNPIIRYDGVALPRPVATVNEGATWLVRLSLAGAIALIALIGRVWGKSRRS